MENIPWPNRILMTWCMCATVKQLCMQREVFISMVCPALRSIVIRAIKFSNIECVLRRGWDLFRRSEAEKYIIVWQHLTLWQWIASWWNTCFTFHSSCFNSDNSQDSGSTGHRQWIYTTALQWFLWQDSSDCHKICSSELFGSLSTTRSIEKSAFHYGQFVWEEETCAYTGKRDKYLSRFSN